MSGIERSVQNHYGAFGDREAILTALAKRGISAKGLTPAQLAPFDQFHTGGAVATQSMAEMLAPRPTDHILDVGCGMGGPARMLADLKGCRVTGLDLAPHFIENAIYFTDLTGQSGNVDFRQGSALALPFEDAVFDGAWHLHVSMNVPDKRAMYAELFRVLKAGTSMAIHDPVGGGTSEVAFPVPWAVTAESSFLCTRDDLLACLETSGFEISEVQDATAEGIAWFADVDANRRKLSVPNSVKASPRTPSLLEIMTKNHRANLEAGAVTIASILVRKPR